MIFIKVILTKHFIRRLKKRLGLQKKALNRHVQKVVSGCSLTIQREFSNKFSIDYKNRRYIFIISNLNIIFITVFNIEVGGSISTQYKDLDNPNYIPYN